MFPSNQRIDWHRIHVDPDLLRRLSTPENVRGVQQAGGHLALIVLTGACSVYVALNFAWYWLIPVLWMHGTVISTLGAASHELSHERVFKDAWLNRLFLNLFGFLTWDNPRIYMLSHNAHHKFTLHQPDDLEVVLPQKATVFHLILCNFLDYKVFFDRVLTNLYLAAGRGRSEWHTSLLNEADPASRRKVFNWSRLALLGHGVIVFGGLFTGLWILPVVVTLGRLYGGGLIMLMGLPQHIGLVDEVNDFRLSCRTYYLNPFFRFLYWYMNYHIEHHMYPAVPCYHLPRLHQAIRHELPHCPNGLAETWVQIADILVKQKYDPSYQYRARLPEDPAEGPPPSRQDVSDPGVRTEMVRVWECQLCGFIYDEAKGLPEENIAPGTRWDEIPEDWVCPVCGVKKAQFKMVEIAREVAAGKTSPSIDSLADPIVIVGSGLAGYTLAGEIRKINRDIPLKIITADAGESYYKPALSTALAGGKSAEDLVLADAEAMARRLNMEVLPRTRALGLNRSEQRILTDHGEVPYHKLVLALGAQPTRISVGEHAGDSVLSINHIEDYRTFRDRLANGAAVLIVGAGLVGCEFANDLALSGHSVHVLDMADAPLAAILPNKLGNNLRDELEKIGVQWHFDDALESVAVGDDAHWHCRTRQGLSLEASLVLSAIGFRPQTQIARESGLAVNRGIQVNAGLQTSDPHIFALGDCAEIEGCLRPFVLPIQHAAKALARTLLGEPTDMARPPMPIEVKTTQCPVVALPPEPGAPGKWLYEGSPPDCMARFESPEGELAGFVLMGKTTGQVDEMLDAIKATPDGKTSAIPAQTLQS